MSRHPQILVRCNPQAVLSLIGSVMMWGMTDTPISAQMPPNPNTPAKTQTSSKQAHPRIDTGVREQATEIIQQYGSPANHTITRNQFGDYLNDLAFQRIASKLPTPLAQKAGGPKFKYVLRFEDYANARLYSYKETTVSWHSDPRDAKKNAEARCTSGLDNL